MMYDRNWWADMSAAFTDDAKFAEMTGSRPESVCFARAFGRGEDVRSSGNKCKCFQFDAPASSYTIHRPTITVNGREVPKPRTMSISHVHNAVTLEFRSIEDALDYFEAIKAVGGGE